MLNGMARNFIKDLLVSNAMKDEALDIAFYWTNESGQPAHLTGGIKMQTTVSKIDHKNHWQV